MAYGDYDGPNKPDKGKENGSCNRTRCQCSPASWYNHGSYSWYCDDCRNQIQFDHINLRGWEKDFGHLGHPMFETREMIDARSVSPSQSAPALYQRLPSPDVLGNGWIEVRAEDIHHYKKVGQQIRALYPDPAGVLKAAKAWAVARSAMVDMPMSSPDWRNRLNALSEAEDKLARAVVGNEEKKVG